MNTISSRLPFFKWTAIVAMLLLFSCETDDDPDPIGNWIHISDFEGIPRTEAASFQIGDRGYVTTGYDGFDRLGDLWEYDPLRDFWIQRASFPGKLRNSAVAFSIGEYGYVGTGYDGTNELGDFWRYDPESDTWDSITPFGGSPRYNAVAFAVGGKGYVGTGYDGNNLKDMWQYDPVADEWTQTVSVGGSKRVEAFAFVLNDRAYVGGGKNNGRYVDDFWEFDPDTGVWTQKTDLINDDDDDDIDNFNLTRSNASTFTAEGRGFLALGINPGNRIDLWEYEPNSDTWEEKTDFEGSARSGAIGFSFFDNGYLLTGSSGGSSAFDDVWLFEPFVENDKDD